MWLHKVFDNQDEETYKCDIGSFANRPIDAPDIANSLNSLLVSSPVLDPENTNIGKIEDVLLNVESFHPEYVVMVVRKENWRTEKAYFPFNGIVAVKKTGVRIGVTRKTICTNVEFDPTFVEKQRGYDLVSLRFQLDWNAGETSWGSKVNEDDEDEWYQEESTISDGMFW